MRIGRDREKVALLLNHKGYLENVITKFNIDGAKVTKLPLTSQFHLSSQQSPKDEEERKYMGTVPYSNVVGSIMYSMVCTRADLAHAISSLSRFMSNPRKEHWQAQKWLLRYIAGTVDYGLVYIKHGDHVKVKGFVDSDYARDIDSRSQLLHISFQFVEIV